MEFERGEEAIREPIRSDSIDFLLFIRMDFSPLLSEINNSMPHLSKTEQRTKIHTS